MNRIANLLICMAAIPVLAQTQGGKLSFEVASVKPNNSNSGSSSTNFNRGRIVATNVTVRRLLNSSYRVQDFQIIGGPSWTDSDRFDIEAKPEEGAVPAQQGPRDPTAIGPLELMMQSLLEDRFQLKLHRETRELPVYTLSVAKDGLKLKAVDPTARAERPVAASSSAPGRFPLASEMNPGNMQTSVSNGVGRMSAGAIPISNLIRWLSGQLARTVIDKTELKDSYDVHIEWASETRATAIAPTPGGAPAPPAADVPSGPTIFTALQEQLGLKLDSTRGPVEVLIIDSVQKPSEN